MNANKKLEKLIRERGITNMHDYSPKILKAIRKFFGLNQSQLADNLGIRQGTLSKIESGKLDLSAIQWVGICSKFALNSTCIFTGKIDAINSLQLDPAKTKPVGGFKINKKYQKYMGCSVREVLPLIKVIENKLGDEKKENFLKECKLDPDYLIIQNLPINLLFMQDIYFYLKEHALVSNSGSDEIVDGIKWQEAYQTFTLNQKFTNNINMNFKRLIKLIPEYLNAYYDFDLHDDKDCYIEVKNTTFLKKLNLKEEFLIFKMNHDLKIFNHFAKSWGADFLLKTSGLSKNGWAINKSY